MSKRKPRRSREFKKNSQVVDFDEARRERREKRELAAKAEKKKRKQEPERQTESARKKTKKNRRRLVYAGIILAIAGLIVFYGFNILSLLHERADVEKEHERLVAAKERLQQELEWVNSPEYIEQQARSHLRLIKPGEVLFLLPQDSDEKGDNPAEGEENGE